VSGDITNKSEKAVEQGIEQTLDNFRNPTTALDDARKLEILRTALAALIIRDGRLTISQNEWRGAQTALNQAEIINSDTFVGEVTFALEPRK
jgi:hypothetical protein